MRATYRGPAFSDTIIQAAPTLCMKVPISETTFAVSRLRNVGERNGRQRLVDGRLDEFGNGSHLAFLTYQERCRNPVFVSFYLCGPICADRTLDRRIAWPRARSDNLHHNRLVTGLGEVGAAGWLGVEGPGR